MGNFELDLTSYLLHKFIAAVFNILLYIICMVGGLYCFSPRFIIGRYELGCTCFRFIEMQLFRFSEKVRFWVWWREVDKILLKTTDKTCHTIPLPIVARVMTLWKSRGAGRCEGRDAGVSASLGDSTGSSL